MIYIPEILIVYMAARLIDEQLYVTPDTRIIILVDNNAASSAYVKASSCDQVAAPIVHEAWKIFDR